MIRLWIILVGAFIGCNTPEENSPNNDYFLGSQKEIHLRKMSQQVASEYSSAANELGEKEILARYEGYLDSYIKDTCGSLMDSMRFTVSRVQTISPGLFDLKFDGDEYNTSFHYTLDTRREKNPKIYEFIKSLRVGSDTIGSFKYMGKCEINRPTSNLFKTFEIEAIPVPVGLEVDSLKKNSVK